MPFPFLDIYSGSRSRHPGGVNAGFGDGSVRLHQEHDRSRRLDRPEHHPGGRGRFVRLVLISRQALTPVDTMPHSRVAATTDHSRTRRGSVAARIPVSCCRLRRRSDLEESAPVEDAVAELEARAVPDRRQARRGGNGRRLSRRDTRDGRDVALKLMKGTSPARPAAGSNASSVRSRPCDIPTASGSSTMASSAAARSSPWSCSWDSRSPASLAGRCSNGARPAPAN